MDKGHLIGVSLCAVVLLVLALLGNVVGYQTVQSLNKITIIERVNQREESACGINDITPQIREQDQVRLDHKSVRNESRAPSETPSTSIEWITYVVEILRNTFLIGSFKFQTVNHPFLDLLS